MKRRFAPPLATLMAFLLTSIAAWAHHPGFSSLAVQMREDAVLVELTLARVDTERLYPLDGDRDGLVRPAELEQARAALEELALQMVELTGAGASLTPDNPTVSIDENQAVHFALRFVRAGAGKLALRSLILNRLPPEHRQYFTLHDQHSRLLGAWLLERQHQQIVLPEAEAEHFSESPQGFVDFFKLGIEHIVTGFDHLVFLFGLLIVGGRFVAAVKIITAFTVAHSITLALATFNLIRISPAIVEPLIAASIIYVGIENIFRRDLENRWMLAFAFGLIHGCGFATILRDLGVGGTGSSGVAVPLLSFNLGVETGQVVIAAVVLPVIWKLKQRPAWKPRYVPACSVVIALVGAYWLIDRLVGIVKS